MNVRRVDDIPRDDIIKSALRFLRATKRGKSPAWAVVRDLCGVGSTSAVQICEEIGIDPHKPYKP
jgi:ribosomal protein S13